ncbi:serine hydrolase domain-containing protein [Gorillibacterium massiliense]|uniref:serine hydrolase domain-containing protein n=1 Tax=Gorillibacterium massiliense TaxID=1280390 RepID=UPI0004AE24BC|nr:serine hydrolase domain-containing protein [Gorillibacterium massiliense]
MENIQQKLEKYMQKWSDSNRFSGTILITQGDRCLLRKGYGYANYEYQIPNEASTIFNIGSITKQFTAAAVLQQVENGKLRLDDWLGSFLQEYKHAGMISIHHLMSSTSGIPDYTELPEYNTRDRLSVDRIIEWLNARPLNFTPGHNVQKSNSNFVLLAKIVEIVSGMDIETYFQKYLYEPAKLEFTGVCHNEDVIANKAYGYSVSGEGVVQADYYEMSGAYGSGNLYSNADDLLKWTKALAEGVIINKESYQKMITPNGFLWYIGASVGYGCSVNGDPVNEVSVDGNIYGYTCCIQKYLKDNFTVIVLSNNDAVPTSRIVKGIKSILLAQETQIIVKPDMHDNVDYRKYIPLMGEYYFPPTGWRFAIRFENGCLNVDRLFIQESKRKKFGLKLVSDHADLVVLACEVCDSTFFFHRDAKGNVQKVVYTWDTLELPYEPKMDAQPDIAG